MMRRIGAVKERTHLLLRDGFIVTMDDRGRAVAADLRIDAGRIQEIAPKLEPASGEETIDCRGMILMPGFVQAHVHLCQTLLRNAADDLALLDWLKRFVWPYEAWLDEAAMSASARLGLAELIAGGTTAILDMGSVRHTDALFAAALDSGIRYTGGKCLMDRNDGGQGPAALFDETAAALEETERLIRTHHESADGRLRYAVSPRFAVSCSDELLRRANIIACRSNARLHTHASENIGEVEVIRARTGRTNVDFLSDMGMLGSQTALAHCVHVTEHEMNLIWGTGTHVVHCPSSNLKLGSGIAPIPAMLEQGINVALGADGAPCNNRLSIFRELHLASLIQKPILGPSAMPAKKCLEMATMGGARALGLEDEIGSIEKGKRADILVLDLNRPESYPYADPVSAIVFSAGEANVRDVLVGGRFLKRDGRLVTIDPVRALDDARRESARFFSSANAKTA